MTEEIGTLHRDKQSLEEASEMSQARIKELEALVEKLQVPCFCLFVCTATTSVPAFLNGD